MIDGYYYLHENGSLIYKPKIVVETDREYFQSPFVKKWWPLDTTDRSCAWTIVLEAMALGADMDRIKDLAGKWGLTFEDSIEFIKNTKSSELSCLGLKLYAERILKVTLGEYWEKVDERILKIMMKAIEWRKEQDGHDTTVPEVTSNEGQ